MFSLFWPAWTDEAQTAGFKQLAPLVSLYFKGDLSIIFFEHAFTNEIHSLLKLTTAKCDGLGIFRSSLLAARPMSKEAIGEEISEWRS